MLTLIKPSFDMPSIDPTQSPYTVGKSATAENLSVIEKAKFLRIKEDRAQHFDLPLYSFWTSSFSLFFRCKLSLLVS